MININELPRNLDKNNLPFVTCFDIILIAVLFPAPFKPAKATIPQLFILRSIFFNEAVFTKFLEILVISIV